MKVHMPSKEEEKLIKLKSDYCDALEEVISNEQDQHRLFKDLAKRLQKTAKSKRELVNILEKIIKAEEIAVRNPTAEIDKDEIRTFKRSLEDLSVSLQNQQEFSDAFLDLANQLKEFLKKKEDYLDLYSELVKKTDKWQSFSMKLMKLRNKYEKESKIRKVEDKISDIDSDIGRIQNQTDRKMDYLMDEAKALDRAWLRLKNAIQKFGW
ncbi:MAG: hypothetical protein GF364_06100 [Candidatus Lokiarchaeota archaeon]|nr:hypothetical protein [Candidatus Lokiarchaeota archaeon]